MPTSEAKLENIDMMLQEQKQLIYIIPESALDLQIPYYESVSAGFPSPAEDYLEHHLDLNDYLIKHPESTFFVKVEGYSMMEAGILPEDILIVDRSIYPKHDDIIIGVLDGDFTVKRLIYNGKNVILKAENKNYSNIEITRESNFVIWGVVTNVIHQFK